MEKDPLVSGYRRRKEPKHGWVSLLLLLACIVFLFVGVLGAGVVIGWQVVGSSSGQQGNWGGTVNGGSGTVPVGDYLDGIISADNIRQNLENLSVLPHIAGKQRNKELAEMLYQQWIGYGFDDVQMINYTVLLAYPDANNPSSLQVIGSDGSVVYTANTTQEHPLTPGEDDPTVAPPFNAYSGVGSAEGPLVYVNYGRIEDFLYLQDNLSISLNGSVCMARYGAIFRGDKAKLGQRFGCIGMIIFSDPADFAPRGGAPVYPDGPNLPPGGVQRGSVQIRAGDPLTPDLPSIDGVSRRSYAEAIQLKDVPEIPVQPISYGDAIHFMEVMDSGDVPADWQGEMNVTYHIQSTNDKARIEVTNVLEQQVINNVIGTIYGSVEPDKMVMLGNHRDAWVFGAVDPSSGTAVMMEIARGLGQLRERGWRPGRSIVLCSWDAEEYGLIGSVEYVEDHVKMLTDNAVVYLNVDSAVSGTDFFSASASPLLFQLFYNVTQTVKCPCEDYGTVYEQWAAASLNSARPPIYNLGSGSDFERFYQALGVPSSDSGYQNSGSYPVYHSVHDNLYWMEKFGDPQFTAHQAMGRIWGRMALMIATTPLLPYRPLDYAKRLNETYSQLMSTYGSTLIEQNITTDLLSSSIEEFSDTAEELETLLRQHQQTSNDGVLRILNNKLTGVDRAFIHAEGLPGRYYMKHVIFAPSSVNNYAGASFPGVGDSLFNATTAEDWEQVRRQLDIVAVHVRYATQIMTQPVGLDALLQTRTR